MIDGNIGMFDAKNEKNLKIEIYIYRTADNLKVEIDIIVSISVSLIGLVVKQVII